MTYNYRGVGPVTVKSKEYSVIETLHVFEEDYSNGYGHKYRYAIKIVNDSFDGVETMMLYKYDGEAYRPTTYIPTAVLAVWNVVADIIY